MRKNQTPGPDDVEDPPFATPRPVARWMRYSRSRGVLVAGVVGMLVVPACENDASSRAESPGGAEPGEALPSPAGSVFTEGQFDDIPIFRGATPLQGPSEVDGAVSASYETKTATPERVLRFYDDNLHALGWKVADRVRETSDGVWRGDWIRDGQRLQVSALPFQAGDDEVGPHTQFSLVLLENTEDVPVGATIPGA